MFCDGSAPELNEITGVWALLCCLVFCNEERSELDTHLHRQPPCLSAWLGFYLCSEPETEKNNCKECRKAKAKRNEHLGFISSRKDGSILPRLCSRLRDPGGVQHTFRLCSQQEASGPGCNGHVPLPWHLQCKFIQPCIPAEPAPCQPLTTRPRCLQAEEEAGTPITH